LVGTGGPHAADRPYGNSVGERTSRRAIPESREVTPESRAPLTVAGCGRRASVREADAEQEDGLGARVVAVRASVEIPGHVAKEQQVQTGMDVPRAEAARYALQRERDESADIEEAELVAGNAVVRIELLVIVAQAETQLHGDGQRSHVFAEREAQADAQLEIGAFRAAERVAAVSLAVVRR